MKYITITLTVLLVVIGYGTQSRAVAQGKTTSMSKRDTSWYSYSKHYDEPSDTYYFLTRIKRKDKHGNLKKIKLAQSTVLEGESVRQFAERVGATLAFNASMGIKRKTTEEKLFPVGIQIENGKVVQEREAKRWRFTLGIKPDNEFVVYPPGTTATEILKDGVQDALTAFIPLIQNHKEVDDSILSLTGAFKAQHPRQIIAQMENLDIIFLSCGGR
ncbi:phosphodiester glycosidase family protein, partial [Sphingobacterium sp. SGG-5]|uniref:phosphodiester glycosidase family protein n=1 Tax=Sphingobacterium sp. SGG-5 TaxID=2710881 RepID=UPI0013E9D14E